MVPDLIIQMLEAVEIKAKAELPSWEDNWET